MPLLASQHYTKFHSLSENTRTSIKYFYNYLINMLFFYLIPLQSYFRPPEYQEGFLIIIIEAADDEPAKKIVRLFVSYDMGWSQRSNGYKYDSLNGFCAIIGLHTGKVLDYCTKNRKCVFCDHEEATGRAIKHDCRLNHYGPAKSMEAAGAVQLTVNSQILKDNNAQIGVFIGDNDSSSISAIQQASDHMILKQSDLNHTKKGVGNKLYTISADKALDSDNELSHDAISYLALFQQ